jgi:hypothetical protein
MTALSDVICKEEITKILNLFNSILFLYFKKIAGFLDSVAFLGCLQRWNCSVKISNLRFFTLASFELFTKPKQTTSFSQVEVTGRQAAHTGSLPLQHRDSLIIIYSTNLIHCIRFLFPEANTVNELRRVENKEHCFIKQGSSPFCHTQHCLFFSSVL